MFFKIFLNLKKKLFNFKLKTTFYKKRLIKILKEKFTLDKNTIGFIEFLWIVHRYHFFIKNKKINFLNCKFIKDCFDTISKKFYNLSSKTKIFFFNKFCKNNKIYIYFFSKKEIFLKHLNNWYYYFSFFIILNQTIYFIDDTHFGGKKPGLIPYIKYFVKNKFINIPIRESFLNFKYYLNFSWKEIFTLSELLNFNLIIAFFLIINLFFFIKTNDKIKKIFSVVFNLIILTTIVMLKQNEAFAMLFLITEMTGLLVLTIIILSENKKEKIINTNINLYFFILFFIEVIYVFNIKIIKIYDLFLNEINEKNVNFNDIYNFFLVINNNYNLLIFFLSIFLIINMIIILTVLKKKLINKKYTSNFFLKKKITNLYVNSSKKFYENKKNIFEKFKNWKK